MVCGCMPLLEMVVMDMYGKKSSKITLLELKCIFAFWFVSINILDRTCMKTLAPRYVTAVNSIYIVLRTYCACVHNIQFCVFIIQFCVLVGRGGAGPQTLKNIFI